jgi:acyltransferase
MHRKRFHEIDNAKALCIVLVAIGHAPGMPWWLTDLISAIRMPLFFFVSGMLLSDKKLAIGVQEKLLQSGRLIVLPYLFFFVLSFALWLMSRRLSGNPTPGSNWPDALAGFFIGTGNALFVNAPLWFFPCLFCVSLIFFGARRFLSARDAVLFFLILSGTYACVFDSPDFRLFWSLDSALVAVFFYAMGHWLMRYRDQICTVARERNSFLPAAVAGIALCVGLSAINGRVDFNTMRFGAYPLLFIPAAVAGIIGTFSFSALLPNHPVLQWLAKNTLVIFPLHYLFFMAFNATGMVFLDLPRGFWVGNTSVGCLYVVLALLCCYPASKVLYFLFPWVFPHIAARPNETAPVEKRLGELPVPARKP